MDIDESAGADGGNPAAPTGSAVPLGFLLASVGQQAGSGFRDALLPHDISPRQFAVLWSLSRDGNQTQQQLSQRLRIPPSRVVALVDQLEGRGVVERRSAVGDRRTRTITLTPGGQHLLGTLWEVASDYQRRLDAALTGEEQAMLGDLLRRIAAQLAGSASADPLRAW